MQILKCSGWLADVRYLVTHAEVRHSSFLGNVDAVVCDLANGSILALKEHASYFEWCMLALDGGVTKIAERVSFRAALN